MNIKKALLVVLAGLLLPGLAFAQTSTRATFTVQKFFDDGNTDQDVTINIQCFTGLPLNQSQTVNPDNSGEFEVKFVVESFDSGELDCEIWEDDILGYSGYYEADSVAADDYGDDYNDGPCVFEGVRSSDSTEDQSVCTITNYVTPIEVEVKKDWVIEGSGGDEIDPGYKLKLVCDSKIINGYECGGSGVVAGDDDYGYCQQGTWSKKWKNDYGTEDASYFADVVPYWDGGTHCWVQEDVYDSSVEVTNGCGGGVVIVEGPSESSPGGIFVELGGAGDSVLECTITNTVFYEGIPTLSQYGLAVLALLMLGVGFIGFRRLV